MLIRIILLCLMLVPAVSHAKQLSQTFKISHSNLKVIKGYDSLVNKGTISLKSCKSCEERKFILTSKTVLAENGFEKPIEDLLQIKLSNKTDHVLVQVNKFDQTVFYIEWGYPEGEDEGQE
jgi:hypothetical protein